MLLELGHCPKVAKPPSLCWDKTCGWKEAALGKQKIPLSPQGREATPQTVEG